ncbi:O-methyltransferase [Cylindrobasidium torrendii FP15055 ss-10]|uniref:O-methyltransferase n=1 Tax=Cylindrobasidium torrendii FP15055 ss-10 TaxID=1314674 RepID=A0A0D7BN79_9AGAR|nr:O-methyltransferase [Cylindrobasidium torrendii FP15055 ss-10]
MSPHRPSQLRQLQAMGVRPLRQLVDLISSAVDAIEHAELDTGVNYPSLQTIYDPHSPREKFAADASVERHASVAVSACYQLLATLGHPEKHMYLNSGAFHIPAAMRVTMESCVPEILRSHPEGLHAEEIAQRINLKGSSIGRLLRLLATHHIFTEVAPNVFKNNRLSSVMDTGKTVEQIRADPINKHAGTSGCAALLEQNTDWMFKSGACLYEALTQRRDCSLGVAFRTKNLFEWLEQPGNERSLARFGASMQGHSNMEGKSILDGYDWSSLKPGSVVVDLAGGSGHVSMRIMEHHPNLRFVVQDRAAVIDSVATKLWQTHHPSAVDGGNVKLQAHDFYCPQPVKNASVFLIQKTLHNYNDERCVRILKHLREAAMPDTKLIVVDMIVVPTCSDTVTSHIKGYKTQKVPWPLLANLGRAGAEQCFGDMQMFTAIGGIERTVGGFERIFSDSGWKLEEIFRPAGAAHRQLIARIS